MGFLHKPLVSSYHTNLAAYCEHFGFSLLKEPMWSYNRFVHNQCAMTFCPSLSTAAMLRLQGEEKIAGYRARLAHLVTDEQLRNKMSLAALMEAQKRSWHDAMECLIRGYCEVIKAAKRPVAV